MTRGARRTPGVLLISPGIIKWTDRDFGLPHLVSMGGYLEQQLGVRVEIIDLSYEGGDHHHLQRRLQEHAPYLLIGLSCYSSFDYMRVMTLARFLRQLYPQVPLVAGGYHASAVPDDLVYDGSPFDAVVVGEGELPLARMVEQLLGGQSLQRGTYGPQSIASLDELPPYRWELLQRYWPRARELGAKLQIYLSRGCPYRCTFCMERAKSADDPQAQGWRAFSPERALDELRRLARFTDLAPWIVNVADPLFGWRRAWRREVLAGILHEGLQPQQFWTLTRCEDLDEHDVELLARARFSIGIGLESGAPEMLAQMRKTRQPERYLAAVQRLARASRQHRLNWAANVIVGHPGETEASLRRSFDFVRSLYEGAAETWGWLSVDPFRLYPGSHVHEHLQDYSARTGARFHHPRWWHSWYDTSFRAEHIDPGAELSFAQRVRLTYALYGPLVTQILDRFRGQGRGIDRSFRRSIEEQARLMSESNRDVLLRRAAQAQAQAQRDEQSAGGGPSPPLAAGKPALLRLPIGLQVRDAAVRRREDAVRRLLEAGVLRSPALIDALLTVAPEQYLPGPDVAAMLADAAPPLDASEPALPLGITSCAAALEALDAAPGDRVADVLAVHGYISALLWHLVQPTGEVVAVCPLPAGAARALRRRLRSSAGVKVTHGAGLHGEGLRGQFDALWIGAALPTQPRQLLGLLAEPGGRVVTWIGPRWRAQDLVVLSRSGDAFGERIVGRTRVADAVAPGGWRQPAARRGG